MSNRATLLGAFLAVAAILAPGIAGAADLIVVEARGVGYAQGAKIDAAKPLVLKEGQHLTLISATGATLKIDGPYNQVPDVSGKGVDLSTKLAALAAGGQRYGEVGTTRSVTAHTLPAPWLIDVSRTGTGCVQEGRTPMMWRPAQGTKTEVVLAPNDRSWRATLEWPSGQDRVNVPASVPLHAGTTYSVQMNGERAAISIEMVPASLDTARQQAAWMVQKGCEAQAEAMLRTAR